MLTVKELKNDEEIQELIKITEVQLEILGYTEHSNRHLSIVANWAGEILKKIGATEREIHLVEIAGYLHDIGNAVNRYDHSQSGALLSYQILTKKGMSYRDAAEIMLAIGNHDETHGEPVSTISAALILADKADVHKSRVRKNKNGQPRANIESDIHDRVNLAAESSFLEVDKENKIIMLNIIIDTKICSVMDYFEIYFYRMNLCKRAAKFLGYKFSLKINNVVLL